MYLVMVLAMLLPRLCQAEELHLLLICGVTDKPRRLLLDFRRILLLLGNRFKRMFSNSKWCYHRGAGSVGRNCFNFAGTLQWGFNGSATANPSGGTAPYTYNWSNLDTNQTASGLAFGTYTCTITDAHGCDTTISVSISEPTAIAAGVSHVNVDCYGNATGSDSAFASGGTPNYTYLWNSVPPQLDQVATGLTAGIYAVTITDANGCSIVVSDTITEPIIIDATISITDIDSVNCNDGLDGSATVTVSGGSFPYTYLWSPVGGNGATASNLGAGN